MYRARLFQWFFKITAYIPQKLVFRIKIHYEDKNVQSRRIKGKAIIASNHMSLFDYIPLIFVFPFRTVRCVVAEVLYKKFFLALYLNLMGAMKVNRGEKDFSFEETAFKLLDKNGVILFHPEGRLPDREGDVPPLEFKTTFVYMALKSKAPIIPYYTNGENFSLKRCNVMIGKPIDANALYDFSLSEQENRRRIANIVREKIIELKNEMEKQNG